MVLSKEDLERLMEKASQDLNETSELGEVAREFNDFSVSSSNLAKDEHVLLWRGKNILKRMSPKSVDILEDFMDSKRSVGGWNTDKKVQAITGIQESRGGGGFMEKMFANKK